MPAKSEFFTPVEFTKASSADQPDTKVVWDAEHLAVAKEAIDKEVVKIRNGTSDLVPVAIDNGKFKTPAETAILTFLEDPSDFTFDRVKELAVQDYGLRAGDHFLGLLRKARTEVPDGDK